MKNMIIKQDTTTHSGMSACLSYTLFSSPTDRNTNSYGVTVTNELTGETATISDITESLDSSEQLFDRLLTGCVTPLCLKEVVEDFVAEI